MSIVHAVRETARARPDDAAVIAPDDRMSFANLVSDIDRIASGLLNAGVRPGDRIAVHAENRPALVAVYYATFAVGAILVPVSRRLPGADVAYQVRHSDSRFYIGDTTTHHLTADALGDDSPIERAWLLDRHGDAPMSWDDLVTTTPVDLPDVDQDAIAALFYTSGTTGAPKAHAFTPRSIEASVGLLTQQGLGNERGTYPTIDLVYPWCVLATATCLCRGNPIVITRTHTPDVVLDTISSENCGWVGGAPSLFRSLLLLAKSRGERLPDFSRTTFFAGGDVLTPTLSREFLQTFGAPIHSSYGQTETGGPVTLATDIHEGDDTTIGRPLDGVRIAIDSEHGEPGELLVRTPSRPVGLWNGASVDLYDPDAWIATADMVRHDSEGRLVFLGRRKDMITVSGVPVPPVEVEKAIDLHPGVSAASVLGVPDATTGQRVVAVIVLRTDRALTEGDILDHLGPLLESTSRPTEVVFAERLPLLPSGKVDRNAVAAEYAAATHRRPVGTAAGTAEVPGDDV